MSVFDQIFNHFLTVENPNLAIYGQKLSVALEEDQAVRPFPFLIYKKGLSSRTYPRPPSAPTQRKRRRGWVSPLQRRPLANAKGFN